MKKEMRGLFYSFFLRTQTRAVQFEQERQRKPTLIRARILRRLPRNARLSFAYIRIEGKSGGTGAIERYRRKGGSGYRLVS